MKNSISLDKATPLHSFVDHQMELYFNTPCNIESRLSVTLDLLRLASSVHSSHTSRSRYSTCGICTHAVVEADDRQSFRNGVYSLLVDDSISITKDLLIHFQCVKAKSCTLELIFMKLLPLKGCDSIAISKELLLSSILGVSIKGRQKIRILCCMHTMGLWVGTNMWQRML